MSKNIQVVLVKVFDKGDGCSPGVVTASDVGQINIDLGPYQRESIIPFVAPLVKAAWLLYRRGDLDLPTSPATVRVDIDGLHGAETELSPLVVRDVEGWEEIIAEVCVASIVYKARRDRVKR